MSEQVYEVIENGAGVGRYTARELHGMLLGGQISREAVAVGVGGRREEKSVVAIAKEVEREWRSEVRQPQRRPASGAKQKGRWLADAGKLCGVAAMVAFLVALVFGIWVWALMGVGLSLMGIGFGAWATLERIADALERGG